MATGPQLVHKQFNSPIGLYSQQNIQETLNKHIHHLDNGATGIDFNDPATGKPGNLANSAVLRMLEEEERTRRGYPKLDPTQVQAILDTLTHATHRFDETWPPGGSPRLSSAKSWEGELDKTYYFPPGSRTAVPADQKKVVWPPVPETNGYHQPPPQQQQQQQQQQPSPAYNRPQQSPQYQSQSPKYQSQAPQYQVPPQQQYQQQQYPPSQPEGRRQEQAAINRLIPVSAGASPYRQGPPSPQAPSALSPRSQQPSRWAPVPSPASPQASPTYQQPQYSPQQQQYAPQQQQYSPQQQQYSPQQQQYAPQQQQYSAQPQYSPQPQQYQQPQPQFEPPPSTVTLRPHPPIHQRPPPVFASQPATASFQGGVNMRGDQKWPPQSVKDAVAAENEARRMLAKGPACRPRRVRKDYTAFFAQNALNSTYPGYRIPPGTQHIEDNSGQTSF